jgi:hypothetical protein
MIMNFIDSKRLRFHEVPAKKQRKRIRSMIFPAAARFRKKIKSTFDLQAPY